MGSKRAGMSWPHAVRLLTVHGPRGFWALALWRLNRLHYSKDIGIPTLPTMVNRGPAHRSSTAFGSGMPVMERESSHLCDLGAESLVKLTDSH